MDPYHIALELTLILAFWIALGAWQREKDIPGRLTFAAAAIAAAFWVAGELIELRGELPLLARRVRMLGVLAIGPLWFGVAAHAVRLPLIRRTPWIPMALMIPVAPLYALLYAGPWSILFIPATDTSLVEIGPLMWWSVGYGWLLALAGGGVLLYGAWTAESSVLRRERAKMAASVAVPMVANGMALWRMAETGHVGGDFTPVMIAVTLIAFRRSILSGGVLDVLPVAQRDIIQHLPFGVVLADSQGAVIELNPAAEEMLGVSRVDALGRGLDAVISRAPLEIRIEVSNVQGRGGETARFALLEAPRAHAPPIAAVPSAA